MTAREFFITLFFMASMSQRSRMFGEDSVKLLLSCVDKSKVKFAAGRAKSNGITLISRSPVLDDIGVLEPDMIAIIAIAYGGKFEKIPVEVIGSRVGTAKYFVCRLVSDSAHPYAKRGYVIHANYDEILGIER